MLREDLVERLKANELPHEEFKLGVRFGHVLVNRDTLQAVSFDGEDGIESLLEYMSRNGWTGLYEEENLIGAQKDNATVILGAGGQVILEIAKTAELKVIDKTYLEFLNAIGNELESRNQLLLSVGYQPASVAAEIPTVPMKKAELLADALKDDKVALQVLKGTAKTTVMLDYAHSDDFEKKYRILYKLAPVFAGLFDNVPYVDGVATEMPVAGLAMQNGMQTALSKVENVWSGHSFKYAQYANITAQAPAIAMEAADGAIVATDKSNQDLYDDVKVSPEMAAGILDMMMTEIRATENGLEVSVDAVPYPLNMAYVGLIKGLFYNADNLNALLEWLNNLNKEKPDTLREDGLMSGLDAKVAEGDLREVAKDLYFIATPILPEEEQHYTMPLDTIIFKHIVPKNITVKQLAKMQNK